MIITIDGADGVGKTTLAKKLSNYLNFEYIRDPLNEIVEINGNLDIKKNAAQKAKNRIFNTNLSDKRIASFLCKSLILLKKKAGDRNLIIDRGMLSAAIYNLNNETEDYFDFLLQKGAEMDISILLISNKDDRINRLKIKAKNNNDPYGDVNNERVLSLETTRTEEFAKKRKMNCIIINTSGKSEDQVFEEALLKIKQNSAFISLSSDSSIPCDI